MPTAIINSTLLSLLAYFLFCFGLSAQIKTSPCFFSATEFAQADYSKEGILPGLDTNLIFVKSMYLSKQRGINYFYKAQKDSANYYFRRSLYYLDNLDQSIAATYLEKGKIQKRLKRYETSLKNFHEAELLAKKEGDTLMLAWVNNEIAGLFAFCHSDEEITYLKKSVEYLEKVDTSPLELLFYQQKLANAFFKHKQYDSARKIYETIIPFLKKNPNDPLYALSELNLARTLLAKEICPDAYGRLEKAKLMFTKLNMDDWALFTDLNLINAVECLENDDIPRKLSINNLSEAFYELFCLYHLEMVNVLLQFYLKFEKFNECISIIDEVEKNKLFQYYPLKERVVFNETASTLYSAMNERDKALNYSLEALQLQDEKERLSHDLHITGVYHELGTALIDAKEKVLFEQLKSKKMLFWLKILFILFLSTTALFFWQLISNSKK